MGLWGTRKGQKTLDLRKRAQVALGKEKKKILQIATKGRKEMASV